MAGTPSIGPHAPVGRGSTMTMKARSDTSAVTRPREINGIRLVGSPPYDTNADRCIW
jgi:hypothetical protein